MAKYSEIKGFTVQTLSTDTVANQAANGAWSSGGSMTVARSNTGGAGIQTSALAISNDGSPYAPNEEYNGTSWAEIAELNTGRNGAGNGANAEAAMLSGGYASGGSNKTERYNGSSWTEVNTLNRIREGQQSTGTWTAAIYASGFSRSIPDGNTYPTAVEEWNGTSWTEVNEVNTARGSATTAGLQTSALLSGGNTPSTNYGYQVESWNGASWTEVAEMNQKRDRKGGSAGVSNTSVLAFGGYTNPAPISLKANSEFWDGTSWTEVADLATARSDCCLNSGGNGGAFACLAVGSTPPTLATIEHFTAPTDFSKITEGQLFFNSTTNTFKETLLDVGGATWASISNVNTPRSSIQNTGAGTSTEGIFFGGLEPSLSQKTENWNGSTWTEKGDLNGGLRDGGGTGIYTSAIAAGGDPGGVTDNAETWNGSAWANITEMAQAREGLGMAGSSNTEVIAFAGGPTSDAQTWNGSAWTEVSDLNTTRKFLTGCGIWTSALAIGGDGPITNKNESWNGTTWSEDGDLNTARASAGSSGTSNTNAFAFGGYISPASTKKNETERWNGTTWTELNNLGTARSNGGAAGNSSTAAFYASGNSGTAATGTSEIFEATVANKTITVS